MCLYLQGWWAQLLLEFLKYVEKFVVVTGVLVDLLSVRLVYIHEVHKYSWAIDQAFVSPMDLL